MWMYRKVKKTENKGWKRAKRRRGNADGSTSAFCTFSASAFPRLQNLFSVFFTFLYINFEYLLCLTCSFLCIPWKLSSIITIMSFRDYMLTFFKRVIQVQVVTWSGHSWCHFSLTCLNGYDIDVLLSTFIYLKECMLEWIWKYQCFINKFIY